MYKLLLTCIKLQVYESYSVCNSKVGQGTSQSSVSILDF